MRHYWFVLLLVTALGAVGSGAVWWFATPRFEMWTTLADTGSSLPDRQVGIVAQTLFQDGTTLQTAAGSQQLTSLDPPVSQAELVDAVQLRSVPDSRLMIVAARGEDEARTAAMSEAVAQTLSVAFGELRHSYQPLSILGPPQPASVETSGSLSLYVILGAITYFLLALGFSVAHYRSHRPVLEFGAMMQILAPNTVVGVSARRRWLGVLRHIAPVGLSEASRKEVAQRLDHGGIVGTMQWPGATRRRQARLMKLVGIALDPAVKKTLIVTEPCSRSRDLSQAALIDPVGTTTVLWLT